MKNNNHDNLIFLLAHLLCALLIAVFAFVGISRSSSALQVSMTDALTSAAEQDFDQKEDREETAEGDDEDAEDDNDPVESGADGLTDGEYSGSAQGYGGPITMKLVVEGGTIKSLDIVSAGGETPAYLNMAKAVIPNIIANGSANVDGVSGATYSSNGIKAASAQALKQAGGDGEVNLKKAAPKQKGKDGKKSKKRAYKKPKGGWKDGTYTGSAKGYGGTVSVKITIRKGKIKKISASGKNETSSYWKRAQAVKKRIIKAQNPRVDAVSGATYSSNGIINAAISALNKAAKSGKGRKDQVIKTGDEDYVLDEGETISLKAKAKTKLSFKSSDKSILKVNKKGSITGVSQGKATVVITAKKTKKYRKAKKKVTVTVFAKDEEDPVEPVQPDQPVQPDEPVTPDLPDEKINGTFSGSAKGYGGQVSVTVIIKDSVIDSIDAEGPDETPKYWTKAKRIIPRMISWQTWNVDAVSGATYSSNGIKNAVKQALQTAGLVN